MAKSKEGCNGQPCKKIEVVAELVKGSEVTTARKYWYEHEWVEVKGRSGLGKDAIDGAIQRQNDRSTSGCPKGCDCVGKPGKWTEETKTFVEQSGADALVIFKLHIKTRETIGKCETPPTG